MSYCFSANKSCIGITTQILHDTIMKEKPGKALVVTQPRLQLSKTVVAVVVEWRPLAARFVVVGQTRLRHVMMTCC